MGFAVDWFYSQFAINPTTHIEYEIEHGQFSSLNTICSVGLLVLIGRGIYVEHIKKLLNLKNKHCHGEKNQKNSHHDGGCC